MLVRTRHGSRARRSGRRLEPIVDCLEGRLLLSGDTTAPATAASVVGTVGLNGFYRTPVTVNFSATDPDNSPSQLTTLVSVNGGAFVPTTSAHITQNGTDTVRFYSRDPAGNVEAMHRLAIPIDTTVPVVTAVASPTSLWPPNHKFQPVTVTGHVSDASGGVPTVVSYHVMDEYGIAQPSGTATVNASGNYSFTVELQVSRLGQDHDGRQYTIVVSATDQAGNTGHADAFAVVPHDQGHRTGFRFGSASGGWMNFVRRPRRIAAHRPRTLHRVTRPNFTSHFAFGPSRTHIIPAVTGGGNESDDNRDDGIGAVGHGNSAHRKHGHGDNGHGHNHGHS